MRGKIEIITYMFFQNTIIKKYIALLNAEQIKSAWEQYKSYFLNPAIQDNIRASKEEQYQEGFLRELFVKVFGYTLNPTPDYNLITEQKNETDAKKADGAILREGKVVGVIELKDHKTTDLSHVERQAFGYKSQHKDTRYVVISNFEKLRFYIDNAVEHIEWNLFTLNEEDFKQLYFCLSWGTLSQDLPLKAKTESVSSEDQITQQLYKDYSAFKREIFADIVANNTDENTPKEQVLLLFKKTQKLLDRLLFIFFAEDSGLLPPNLMMMILDDWQKLKEMDEDIPLYRRIKKYFGYLDTGFQGKKYEIFAYNGGLFKPDEILDGLTISDDLLARFTRKLSEYDYASEVDVNILGHIFENSLNEIEEVTAQINSGTVTGGNNAAKTNNPTGSSSAENPPQAVADIARTFMSSNDAAKENTVSKRKRDGVFYTPQYITKYIVENTVGRLCAEKKAEMGIDEAEYFADKNRQMATKKRLLENLAKYREWLLGITICDPACGSGAFLNAALRFLMDEHKLLDEMEAKITGSAIEFPGVENSILENNLYGVDINEESVEIAKLALWLRTAKPHRKLNSLNNNIKCGNSLISDPEIAGEKAFDWQAEFPQVFAKGGFDVVIGNPPYVQLQTMGKMSDAYAKCGYEVYNKSADLYCLFYEKGCKLLKEKGYLGFIASNKWLKANYGEDLRRFIVNETNPLLLVDFPGVKIFPDATVDPQILVLRKESYDGDTLCCLYDSDAVDVSNFVVAHSTNFHFTEDPWRVMPKEHKLIIEKLNNATPLKNLPFDIYRGVLTGLDEAFYIDEATKKRLIDEDVKSAELIHPVLFGYSIKAWTVEPELYLINPHNGIKEKNIPPVNIDEYPAIKRHLDPYYDKLAKRTDKGITPYNLRNCAYLDSFSVPKIIYPEVTKYRPFMYDESGIMTNKTCFILVVKERNPNKLKALVAILNSKLADFWIWYNCPEVGDDRRHMGKAYFEYFPVPNLDNDELVSLADTMLALNKELQEKRARFLRRLQDNIPGIKINGTLETFDTLNFAGFVAELKKQKIKLSLVQQDEWEDFFNKYKTACGDLAAKIASTDKEIDTLVYDLYGLTEEEIAIVEQ